MAPIAIVFGILLTLLGGGVFVYTGMDKVTSLFPAFFGIPIILLGLLARNEKWRMHTMHGAALLGLIRCAVPAVMVIVVLAKGGDFETVKHGEQSAMAVLCGIFLVLCVRSFIEARKARKAREAAGAAPAHG